ncbi:MAG: DUF1850 domain-containing protein [Angelakisella sp.]
MTGTKKKAATILLLVTLAAAAALIMCLPLLPSVLTLRDGEGHLLWANPKAGGGFTVSFTHSANKGDITESYRFLGDGSFTLTTGTFESYGAGMLDQLPEGVTMVDEGDRLRLFFPAAPMRELPMIAGNVAHQRLAGDGYEVDLAKLSAYSKIFIRHEKASIIEVLLHS